MALNACELEIDLFCRGMRIPDDVSLDGARGISRTRAGLGSGLEITIPTGSWLKPEVWVNVPVVESFAQRSPYVLSGSPAAGYTLTKPRRLTATSSACPGNRNGTAGRRRATSR